MRPFILRNLKTVQGLAPEDRFQNEADIDFGDFPHLFRKYWHNVFERRFDPDRDARSAVGIITEARNQVSHPGTEDLTSGYALSRLHEIADILGQINAPEQKQEVEAIRDKLLISAAPTVDTKPKLPRRKAADLTHGVMSYVLTQMSLKAPSENRNSPPTFKRFLKEKRKRQNTAKPISFSTRHTLLLGLKNC